MIVLRMNDTKSKLIVNNIWVRLVGTGVSSLELERHGKYHAS